MVSLFGRRELLVVKDIVLSATLSLVYFSSRSLYLSPILPLIECEAAMQQLIIDVREPEEYSTGHVEGAINIPPSELLEGAQALQGYPKDTPIILYCRSGSRSQVSINLLRQQGFSNLTNGINQQNVEKTLR